MNVFQLRKKKLQILLDIFYFEFYTIQNWK